MKILITGICGFVGRTIAEGLLNGQHGHIDEIVGIDNLVRPGSWLNRDVLRQRGVTVLHGDIRQASDVELIGNVDWVIDAAANPNVQAGGDGKSSARQLVEHNLLGTINLLEHCKTYSAGFIIMSTSRVYGINPLASLKLDIDADGFSPITEQEFPIGISQDGIAENCSTEAPLSLYGATKLASETLALEYGSLFSFPVWINRCGVLAGAGQFGRSDQGVFSYWIHSWLARKSLKYSGFGGSGYQVRDCLHPKDLISLIQKQMSESSEHKARVINLGGGRDNSISLRNLSHWCEKRFGSHQVGIDSNDRLFDVPWIVMDTSKAQKEWGWNSQIGIECILSEIAEHAEANPDWLQLIDE